MSEYTGEPCWNKDLMYKLHIEEGMSARQISKEVGERRKKVIFWLRKHEIYEGDECPGCGEIFRHIGQHFNSNPGCIPEDKEDNPLYESYVCSWCSEAYYLRPNSVNHSLKGFCSNECRIEWLESGGPHSEEYEEYEAWAIISKKIRERDDNMCRVCGMSSEEHYQEYGVDLHVHHIIPASDFESQVEANTPENLITLCHAHHTEYEGETEELLRSSGNYV